METTWILGINWVIWIRINAAKSSKPNSTFTLLLPQKIEWQILKKWLTNECSLFSNYKRLWSSFETLETEQLCINTDYFTQYAVAVGILTIPLAKLSLIVCVSIKGSQLRRPENEHPPKTYCIFLFGIWKDFMALSSPENKCLPDRQRLLVLL